ncbi:MAG: Tol-Pal system protein TolR [uncultured Thiotrichaceae bacterium]|uniref:Tol-Pal system protein TolR n=1 Tax=uncultured Thiotrichaceae bacterium TaxID=298394 RepID=A0A6S6RYQ7_9GAMM|nr:MAG: Tol-Pal system protein TolR [uncultured Thiotrichaceae bacterium]
MRSTRRPRKSMAEMNVVPYIDVMLVLLVIFMVTAPMMQMGVDIDMPDTGTKSLTTDNQQEPLIISVDQTGQYFLSDETLLGETELRDYIAQQLIGEAAQRPVRIRAAKNVEYHYVMAAVAAAELAGAKVGLMTDPLQ